MDYVTFRGVNLGTLKVKQLTTGGLDAYMQNENTVVTHSTYMPI